MNRAPFAVSAFVFALALASGAVEGWTAGGYGVARAQQLAPLWPTDDASATRRRTELAEFRFERAKPVGTSSVVLKLSSREAAIAFRPRTATHPRGDLSEVAAYELGRALGMDNVVPAALRWIALADVDARVPDDERAAWQRARASLNARGGVVRGAAIQWVSDLRDPGDVVARCGAALRLDAPMPTGADASLCADFSSLVALDTLIANGDRFSGGNLHVNDARTRLYVRDHNLAFPSTSLGLTSRVRERLARTERFSRRFVVALNSLDDDALAATFDRLRVTFDLALLDARQLRGVRERRAYVLSHVASLERLHGRERVLAFP